MAGQGRELKLAITIAGRLDGTLGAAVNSAQAQLNSIAKVGNRAMTATALAVGAAGVKIVKDSIKTYKAYESAVNSAAAVFDVRKGTAEYQILADAAREVGRVTVKSAEEGANALEYMALAGWSVEKSSKALIPVVKLSASTGMDLATTSDLVTDTMAAMGIGIDGVRHYLDVLAKGNNSANYTSQMLLESLANVGGVFRSLNIGIEDGAAVLGILANQGTKGAEAGTQLNTVLTRMQKQSGESAKGMAQLGLSMFDAEGRTRNIIDVFGDMYEATKNMTDEQRNQVFTLIGGTRGYRALTKIMSGYADMAANGTPIIRSLAAAYRDADGALDAFYDIKTDTVEGATTRLARLYEDMQISIGEALAPNLNELVAHLTEKMPEISNVIVSAIERAAPVVMKLLDYIVDNLDTIISGAARFAKTFAAIKIGTATLRGITGLVTLLSNLKTLGAARGVRTVLQGIIGTFTGIGTGAYTAGGAVTGFLATVASRILPAAAAFIVLKKVIEAAYNAWDKEHNHWGDTALESAKALGETASRYRELADIQNELSGLEVIINSSASTKEEVESARSRVREIADLLEREYDLKINADTTGLDDATEKVEQAVKAASAAQRIDFNDKWSGYMDDMANGADNYVKAVENTNKLESDMHLTETKNTVTSDLYSKLHDLQSTYYGGGTEADYVKAVNEYFNREIYGAYGDEIRSKYRPGTLPNQITNAQQAEEFVGAIKSMNDEASKAYTAAADAYKQNEEQKKAWTDAQKSAASAVTDMLIADVMTENANAISNDTDKFVTLGKNMRATNTDTAELETTFAAASVGYQNFADAIAAGKASDMAQNILDYKIALGDSTDVAVQSAALVASGFETVNDATAAGADGINSVISKMGELGKTQGLFRGLDAGGIADKLSDMAHTMSLIPENKSISINADGNFEVIQEAEDQIASLKSVGNVDVSVNSSGDVTVLNEADEVITQLQNVGAVSLQVNADGNIEALNEAQEIIATIDKATGKVTWINDTSAPDSYEPGTKPGTVKFTADTSNVPETFYRSGVISFSSVIGNLAKGGKSVSIAARGTDNFPGGLAIVNDQRGIRDPREVIEYGGARWWYEGRNVLTDIPRGAKIYTAAQSRSFINGSHRNGLEHVPFDGYIAELHRGERVLTSAEAEDYDRFTFGDILDMLGDGMSRRHGDGTDQGADETPPQIVFAPNVTVYGGADRNSVNSAMRLSFNEFKDFMREYERDRSRKAF